MDIYTSENIHAIRKIKLVSNSIQYTNSDSKFFNKTTRMNADPNTSLTKQVYWCMSQ